MSKRIGKSLSCVANVFSFWAIALASTVGYCGFNNNNFGNQVGGVKIDANGVIDIAPVEMRQDLSRLLKKHIKPAADDLQKNTELRMISPKSLDQTLGQAVRNNNGQLPDEIRYLAGIQRVEYVFLYPEENDIVLAGPRKAGLSTSWVISLVKQLDSPSCNCRIC